MDNHRYTDAAALAAAVMDDPTAAERIHREISASAPILELTAARIRRHMTQSDVAKKMGVSVSKVSRFESSRFQDVTMGELSSYAMAVGLRTGLMMDDLSLPAATRIKAYVIQTAALLKEINDIAKYHGDDKALCEGIAKFNSEVLLNFLMKYRESGACETFTLSNPQPKAQPSMAVAESSPAYGQSQPCHT